MSYSKQETKSEFSRLLRNYLEIVGIARSCPAPAWPAWPPASITLHAGRSSSRYVSSLTTKSPRYQNRCGLVITMKTHFLCAVFCGPERYGNSPILQYSSSRSDRLVSSSCLTSSSVSHKAKLKHSVLHRMEIGVVSLQPVPHHGRSDW